MSETVKPTIEYPDEITARQQLRAALQPLQQALADWFAVCEVLGLRDSYYDAVTATSAIWMSSSG